METAPAWYNDPTSGCTSSNGTQRGATCGLFAVNHLIAGAAVQRVAARRVLHKTEFEANALAADQGDARANLIQPGGANYDISVLNVNLATQGLLSHPMTPETLQGNTVDTSRVTSPFSDYISENRVFKCVGYLVRTPQAGGHWIAVLQPRAIDVEANGSCAALICDSLVKAPVQVAASELEHVLMACAVEGLHRTAAGDAHAAHIAWACFLISDAGEAL